MTTQVLICVAIPLKWMEIDWWPPLILHTELHAEEVVLRLIPHQSCNPPVPLHPQTTPTIFLDYLLRLLSSPLPFHAILEQSLQCHFMLKCSSLTSRVGRADTYTHSTWERRMRAQCVQLMGIGGGVGMHIFFHIL